MPAKSSIFKFISLVLVATVLTTSTVAYGDAPILFESLTKSNFNLGLRKDVNLQLPYSAQIAASGQVSIKPQAASYKPQAVKPGAGSLKLEARKSRSELRSRPLDPSKWKPGYVTIRPSEHPYGYLDDLGDSTLPTTQKKLVDKRLVDEATRFLRRHESSRKIKSLDASPEMAGVFFDLEKQAGMSEFGIIGRKIQSGSLSPKNDRELIKEVLELLKSARSELRQDENQREPMTIGGIGLHTSIGEGYKNLAQRYPKEWLSQLPLWKQSIIEPLVERFYRPSLPMDSAFIASVLQGFTAEPIDNASQLEPGDIVLTVGRSQRFAADVSYVFQDPDLTADKIIVGSVVRHADGKHKRHADVPLMPGFVYRIIDPSSTPRNGEVQVDDLLSGQLNFVLDGSRKESNSDGSKISNETDNTSRASSELRAEDERPKLPDPEDIKHQQDQARIAREAAEDERLRKARDEREGKAYLNRLAQQAGVEVPKDTGPRYAEERSEAQQADAVGRFLSGSSDRLKKLSDLQPKIPGTREQIAQQTDPATLFQLLSRLFSILSPLVLDPRVRESWKRDTKQAAGNTDALKALMNRMLDEVDESRDTAPISLEPESDIQHTITQAHPSHLEASINTEKLHEIRLLRDRIQTFRRKWRVVNRTAYTQEVVPLQSLDQLMQEVSQIIQDERSIFLPEPLRQIQLLDIVRVNRVEGHIDYLVTGVKKTYTSGSKTEARRLDKKIFVLKQVRQHAGRLAATVTLTDSMNKQVNVLRIADSIHRPKVEAEPVTPFEQEIRRDESVEALDFKDEDPARSELRNDFELTIDHYNTKSILEKRIKDYVTKRHLPIINLIGEANRFRELLSESTYDELLPVVLWMMQSRQWRSHMNDVLFNHLHSFIDRLERQVSLGSAGYEMLLDLLTEIYVNQRVGMKFQHRNHEDLDLVSPHAVSQPDGISFVIRHQLLFAVGSRLIEDVETNLKYLARRYPEAESVLREVSGNFAVLSDKFRDEYAKFTMNSDSYSLSSETFQQIMSGIRRFSFYLYRLSNTNPPRTKSWASKAQHSSHNAKKQVAELILGSSFTLQLQKDFQWLHAVFSVQKEGLRDILMEMAELSANHRAERRSELRRAKPNQLGTVLRHLRSDWSITVRNTRTIASLAGLSVPDFKALVRSDVNVQAALNEFYDSEILDALQKLSRVKPSQKSKTSFMTIARESRLSLDVVQNRTNQNRAVQEAVNQFFSRRILNAIRDLNREGLQATPQNVRKKAWINNHALPKQLRRDPELAERMQVLKTGSFRKVQIREVLRKLNSSKDLLTAQTLADAFGTHRQALPRILKDSKVLRSGIHRFVARKIKEALAFYQKKAKTKVTDSDIASRAGLGLEFYKQHLKQFKPSRKIVDQFFDQRIKEAIQRILERRANFSLEKQEIAKEAGVSLKTLFNRIRRNKSIAKAVRTMLRARVVGVIQYLETKQKKTYVTYTKLARLAGIEEKKFLLYVRRDRTARQAVRQFFKNRILAVLQQLRKNQKQRVTIDTISKKANTSRWTIFKLMREDKSIRDAIYDLYDEHILGAYLVLPRGRSGRLSQAAIQRAVKMEQRTVAGRLALFNVGKQGKDQVKRALPPDMEGHLKNIIILASQIREEILILTGADEVEKILPKIRDLAAKERALQIPKEKSRAVGLLEYLRTQLGVVNLDYVISDETIHVEREPRGDFAKDADREPVRLFLSSRSELRSNRGKKIPSAVVSILLSIGAASLSGCGFYLLNPFAMFFPAPAPMTREDPRTMLKEWLAMGYATIVVHGREIKIADQGFPEQPYNQLNSGERASLEHYLNALPARLTKDLKVIATVPSQAIPGLNGLSLDSSTFILFTQPALFMSGSKTINERFFVVHDGVSETGKPASSRLVTLNLQGTVMHEMAHGIQNAASSAAKNYYENLYQQSLGDRDNFVSNYATTDYREDFSDTFMYWVQDPDTLFARAIRNAQNGKPLLLRKLFFVLHYFADRNGMNVWVNAVTEFGGITPGYWNIQVLENGGFQVGPFSFQTNSDGQVTNFQMSGPFGIAEQGDFPEPVDSLLVRFFKSSAWSIAVENKRLDDSRARSLNNPHLPRYLPVEEFTRLTGINPFQQLERDYFALITSNGDRIVYIKFDNGLFPNQRPEIQIHLYQKIKNGYGFITTQAYRRDVPFNGTAVPEDFGLNRIHFPEPEIRLNSNLKNSILLPWPARSELRGFFDDRSPQFYTIAMGVALAVAGLSYGWLTLLQAEFTEITRIRGFESISDVIGAEDLRRRMIISMIALTASSSLAIVYAFSAVKAWIASNRKQPKPAIKNEPAESIRPLTTLRALKRSELRQQDGLSRREFTGRFLGAVAAFLGLGSSVFAGPKQDSKSQKKKVKKPKAEKLNYDAFRKAQIERMLGYLKPGVGVDPKSGYAYDGLKGNEARKWTQPTIIGFQVEILAHQAAGDVPGRESAGHAKEALETLDRLLKQLLQDQQKFGRQVAPRGNTGLIPWFKLEPAVQADSTLIAYVDNANLTVSMMTAIGSLIRAKKKHPELSETIDQTIVQARQFLKVQEAGMGYTKMIGFQNGLLRGEVFAGEQGWRPDAYHIDRLFAEHGPKTALLTTYFIKLVPQVFTNLKPVFKLYKFRDGKERLVAAPWNGGAFQMGWAVPYVMKNKRFKIVYENFLKAAMDYAYQNGLPGFLSESVDPATEKYEGKIGFPFHETDEPTNYTISSLYGLDGFSLLAPKTILNWRASILKQLNKLAGPYGNFESATADGQVSKIYVGNHHLSSILGLIGKQSESIQVFLEAEGLTEKYNAFLDQVQLPEEAVKPFDIKFTKPPKLKRSELREESDKPEDIPLEGYALEGVSPDQVMTILKAGGKALRESYAESERKWLGDDPGALAEIAGVNSVAVFGDLHGATGNFTKRFEELGKEAFLQNPKNHIVAIGDYLHTIDEKKARNKKAYLESLRTLLILLQLKIKYPKQVHLLPGNHDYAHAGGTRPGKFDTDQTGQLENAIEDFVNAGPESASGLDSNTVYNFLLNYLAYVIRQMPIVLTIADKSKAKHRLAFVHAGPNQSYTSKEQVNEIKILHGTIDDVLWDRFYEPEFLEQFLSTLESEYLISGHTPPTDFEEADLYDAETHTAFINDHHIIIDSSRKSGMLLVRFKNSKAFQSSEKFIRAFAKPVEASPRSELRNISRTERRRAGKINAIKAKQSEDFPELLGKLRRRFNNINQFVGETRTNISSVDKEKLAQILEAKGIKTKAPEFLRKLGDKLTDLLLISDVEKHYQARYSEIPKLPESKDMIDRLTIEHLDRLNIQLGMLLNDMRAELIRSWRLMQQVQEKRSLLEERVQTVAAKSELRISITDINTELLGGADAKQVERVVVEEIRKIPDFTTQDAFKGEVSLLDRPFDLVMQRSSDAADTFDFRVVAKRKVKDAEPVARPNEVIAALGSLSTTVLTSEIFGKLKSLIEQSIKTDVDSTSFALKEAAANVVNLSLSDLSNTQIALAISGKTLRDESENNLTQALFWIANSLDQKVVIVDDTPFSKGIVKIVNDWLSEDKQIEVMPPYWSRVEDKLHEKGFTQIKVILAPGESLLRSYEGFDVSYAQNVTELLSVAGVSNIITAQVRSELRIAQMA